MKLFITFVTIVNFSCAAMWSLGGSINNNVEEYDKFQIDLARIAVSQKLSALAPLATDASVRLNQGCAERQDNHAGVVVGSGEAMSQSGLIDGVHVSEASRFAYRARVSVNCDVQNLNCYRVDEIGMNQSRSITPRL